MTRGWQGVAVILMLLICVTAAARHSATSGRRDVTSGSASSDEPGRAAPPHVTFTRDIAPIVFHSCAPCHRPGEAAPFSLLSYADAKTHAHQITAVTERRIMPPWLPEPDGPKFTDDLRLTAEQIAAKHRELADHDQSDHVGIARLTEQLRDLEGGVTELENRWMEVSEILE